MQLSAVYIFNQKGCLNPMGSGQNSGCNVDNPSHSKPILSPIPREAEGGSVSSSETAGNEASTDSPDFQEPHLGVSGTRPSLSVKVEVYHMG
ncbi:TPA: hypothetical protein ACH3X3_003176 [Trebouxia sp. C0006]